MLARDGRPLETRRVARHGREPRLPYPAEHVLRGLEAEKVWAGACRDGLLRGVVFGVVACREPGADEEDVARPEGNVLLGGDLL